MCDETLMKSLKECRGEEFFVCLEKYAEIVISVNIKKILTANAYDNAKALSKFDGNSISEIEDFMRNEFNEDMIEDGDTMKDYLGIFLKKQQNFKIVSGQRKTITSMAEECCKFYENQSTNQDQSTHEDTPVAQNQSWLLLGKLLLSR